MRSGGAGVRFAKKVVVVTGAARGIGLACARRFLDEGARVVLADVGDWALAKETLAGSREPVCFERADVGRREEVDRLFGTAVEAFGRVDLLVNNAAVVHRAGFLELTEEDWERVLRTNLTSMFLCGQAAARQMVRQGGGGVILNISSVNAVVALADQVPYTVSKGGVNQLTKVMALSLAPHGIRVMGIGPGTVLTEMSRRVVMTDEAGRRTLLSRTPLRRFGEPSEIASVAAFLGSDDASYLTGTTIYPDGGRLALNLTVPVED